MQNHANHTRIALATVIASLMVTLTTTLHADTFTWDVDADGDWDTDTNWDGTAGEYPDDSADVAELTYDISADRTVTIPTGGVTINQLTAGDPDASHRYILDGDPLQITTGSNGATGLTLNSNATVQIDSDIKIDSNNMGMVGDASGDNETLLLNGTMTRTKGHFEVSVESGLTLVVNTNQSAGLFANSGGTIAVGFDGQMDQHNLNIGDSATLTPYLSDRTISDDVRFGDDDSTFDGAGNTLEITGGTTINSVDGRNIPKNMLTVKDGTLAMSGNVNWNVENSGKDPVSNPSKRNWITLDSGTLEVRGTGNTYTVENNTDIDIRGTGTLLLNNSDGDATGSGNTLILASGVTLGGDGSTASTVSLDGFINPGNSVGELTVGGVTFNDGSELIIELDGAGNDVLNILGDLDLSSSSDTLRFTGTPSSGVFAFLTYSGALTGEFDTIIDETTDGLDLTKLSYENGQIGFVPEPASVLLLALGGLLAHKRSPRRV